MTSNCKYNFSMTWPQYIRHQCTLNGVKYQLARQEARILATLMMRYPCPTPTGLLIESLYENPDEEPEYPDDVAYVIIRGLRVKFGDDFILQQRFVGYVLNKQI